MKIELDVPQELMESIKNQITEYEKENQKPKDMIDFDNGWIVSYKNVVPVRGYFGISIRTIYSQGLYRDTKEEAEKLLRKMQIEHRLRQWAKMCKEKVDLNNYNQAVYYLCLNKEKNKIIIDYDLCSSYLYNDVRFTDKSILQRAIEDIGEQNLIDNYFVEV